ncbi:hypothetical protein [uncultured Tateyamaria sp.]|uniref:hypothetical protein n=1 Tax=uncultured Tateyamaria sp. TaxID=455651 RepID=UPI002606A1F6|nr:hypothetical protein [uncultured Tateyamaria sp.]
MSGQALVGGARLPFATIDWGMALRDRINANHDYARHAADWCDPILFHDTDFGRFVWLDIQRGTCRDVAAWTDAGGDG